MDEITAKFSQFSACFKDSMSLGFLWSLLEYIELRLKLGMLNHIFDSTPDLES